MTMTICTALWTSVGTPHPLLKAVMVKDVSAFGCGTNNIRIFEILTANCTQNIQGGSRRRGHDDV